jgi:hypothetical protein
MPLVIKVLTLMIKVYLFYMVNTIDAFRDYLQKEKSIHQQCLFERYKKFPII